MAIQVNPTVSPRIITIPEVDGDSITIQSLVNQIRNWEDNQANLSYPSLLSATGKDILDSETLVGITACLINAKLKFADRTSPTDCDIYGGNLVALDANGVPMNAIQYADNVTVTMAKSSSATLVSVEDMRTDLAYIKQMESGRWKILSNQMIFYASDGITPIRTFDLKGVGGQPAMEDIYERVPA